MTPSDEIVSRYAKVERNADAFGRVIGVRRLKVSQQTRVAEMTPGLEGDFEVELPESKDEAGNVVPPRMVKLSRRTQLLVAAAVCEIDGTPIPFPKTRGELDAITDRLDEEGLVAAMAAYALIQAQRGGETGIDAAKK